MPQHLIASIKASSIPLGSVPVGLWSCAASEGVPQCESVGVEGLSGLRVSFTQKEIDGTLHAHPMLKP